MKTINQLLLFSYLFLLCSLISSCSSDDESNDTALDTFEATTQSGTWRITRFVDSGIDETANFTGYNFTFNNNGVLSATNGINNYEGSWNIITDGGSDLDDLELTISFSLNNDFNDLTDDWDFISQTPTRLELIDISGGGEPDDLLTLERN